MIGKYIYGKLTADATVTSLVGQRIYPIFIPMDATLPAIAYMVTQGPKDNQMKFNSPDHEDYTVTLHIWADHAQGQEGYDILDQTAAAIRNALERVEATANSVTVEQALYLSARDGRDEDRTLMLREVVYKFTVQR